MICVRSSRIGDIIEQIRRACVFLWQRFGQRMLVHGHSAGGHLTAAMVATDWHLLYPKAPADLVPSGYAISGVFDLSPLVGLSLNQDLRLDAASRSPLSPLLWPVPPAACLDAMVGDLESDEFKRQSRTMAREMAGSRAQTRYEELPGTTTLPFSTRSPIQRSAMVARVAELAQPSSDRRAAPRGEHDAGRCGKDQSEADDVGDGRPLAEDQDRC